MRDLRIPPLALIGAVLDAKAGRASHPISLDFVLTESAFMQKLQRFLLELARLLVVSAVVDVSLW